MKRTWLVSFASATFLTAAWAASALAQATQQPNAPAPNQQQAPAQAQPQAPAQPPQQQPPAQNRQQVPAQTQAPGQTGQPQVQGQIRTGTTQQQARQLQGRVVRTGEGSIIVRTPDNREVTVYTHPRTTYRANNRDMRFNDVRVGSDISFTYDLDGTRYLANNVVIGPAEQVPGVAVQPAAPADGTLVTGRVMRVVGTDQVILQTTDGREVPVYVTPQTVYQIAPQGGAFVDLRPGVDVGVYYDVRDNRFLARRIARRTR